MQDYVLNKDDEKLADKFRQSMQKNGFCIIKNFIEKNIVMQKLSLLHSTLSSKNDVRRTGKTKFKRPNFQRLDLGDYAQINARFNRMITQFTWNEDSVFFNEIKELVDFRNSYLSLEPKNFVYYIDDKEYCDLPKFLQYPTGGGFMNKHTDFRGEDFKAPNFLLNLTKRGKDFTTGGAYYYDRQGNFLDVEEIADIGDLYAHDTKTPHGVHAIDPEKNVDLDNLCGRFSINLSIEEFDY